ncbi:hypothetical protein SNE40_018264 [Patella caerulea]|uniref:Uncharacterized protein n=1 Tax=Patella caerulea TaxID=87958 RepID=A0AAN8PAK7_PATCE
MAAVSSSRMTTQDVTGPGSIQVTSNNRTSPHYLGQHWNLTSKHLQTVFFPDHHTGENLAAGLKDTLDSWGLQEEKQICLTTDNGSNIVKASELNEWQRLQCFGHRLHLAVNCGLKDDRIDRAVRVCKRVVSVFSYSW